MKKLGLQKNFTDLEELLIAEVEIDGPIKRAKRLLDNFVVEIDQLEKQFANLSNGKWILS